MFDLDARIGLYRDRIQIDSAELVTGSSQVKASGSINGFKDPRLNVDVKADAALADLGVPLRSARNLMRDA